MQSEEGFTATSAQDWAQPNRRRARKYLSAHDWRTVVQIADQYKDEGIRYHIYKNGKQITHRELRRARNEHCKGSEYAKLRQHRCPIDLLPECIQFRIVNVGNDVLGTHDIVNVESSSANAFSIDTDFMRKLTPVATNQLTDAVAPLCPRDRIEELHSEPQIPGNMTSILSDPSDEVQDPGSDYATTLLSPGQWLQWLNFSPSLGFSPNEIVTKERSPTPLSLGFEEFTDPQGNPLHDQGQPAFNRPTSSTTIGVRNRSRTDTFTDMFDQIESPISPGASLSSPNPSLLLVDILKSSLSSLPPSRATPSQSLLSKGFAAQQQIFYSSIDRLLVYSVENNFSGLYRIPIGVVLNYMKQDVLMRSEISHYVRVGLRYHTKALAEKLIQAAIENCNAPDVAMLLCIGDLDPNAIICTFDGWRYTALERSAMLQSFDVTKVLLSAGADPNKTYEEKSDRMRGALEFAIRGDVMADEPRAVVDNIPLVNLLILKGAKVTVLLIKVAMESQNAELIQVLMSRLSPRDHTAAFEYRIHEHGPMAGPLIVLATEKLDNELATMVVKQILRACAESGCKKCPKNRLYRHMLQEMIRHAAQRGFLDLVRISIELPVDEGFPLIMAVRNGLENFITFLLESGTNVDPPALKYEISPWGKSLLGLSHPAISPLVENTADSDFCCHSDIEYCTTPLAEALRTGSDELVQYFEEQGALSRLHEGGRFDAAVIAASEAGNLMYLHYLFRLINVKDVEIPIYALNLSIEKGHTEVALFLLKSGASVNLEYPLDLDNLPMIEALRQRNALVVKAIMECDLDTNFAWSFDYMEEAARWGNLDIISDLLSMGVSNDTLVNAVTIAVEEKNQTLIDFLIKDHGARTDGGVRLDDRKSALSVAISKGNTQMLQYLLDLGADSAYELVDNSDFPQYREAIAVLLHAFRRQYPTGKKGFGGGPLQLSLLQEDHEMLDMLLEAKFDVNAICSIRGCSESQNALGTAIEKYGGGSLHVIKKIIIAGGDINSIVSKCPRYMRSNTWPQRTALLQAILSKSKALVTLLIENGADIHRAARLGLKRTPLQYACEVGSLEIVEVLLERGANVNEEPAIRGGATSLQLCAIRGYCGIAERLLSAGADIKAPPAQWNGRTAFDGAAEHGRLHMLMFLWDKEACSGFKAEDWERAKELAGENGHIACRDLLQELSMRQQGLIGADSLFLENSLGPNTL